MPIETATATASANYAMGSVGLSALLVGFFGEIGADVMMVVLASIAGCSIALTGKNKAVRDSAIFITKAILLSVVMAWAISGVIVAYMPQFDTPYLPTVVAFILGFSGEQLSNILQNFVNKKLLGKGEQNA